MPRLGKRLSLAGSIFSSALFCVVFALAREPFLITATTIGINLSATVREISSSLVNGRTQLNHIVTDYVGCAIWVC